MVQIQQGDVLFIPVEVDLSDANEVKRKNGSIVVMEGEATGHAHRITDIDAMFFEKEGKFYLKTIKEVTIKHEEHNPISIPIGTFEIGRVREKDWLSGMVSPVVD